MQINFLMISLRWKCNPSEVKKKKKNQDNISNMELSGAQLRVYTQNCIKEKNVQMSKNLDKNQQHGVGVYQELHGMRPEPKYARKKIFL